MDLPAGAMPGASKRPALGELGPNAGRSSPSKQARLDPPSANPFVALLAAAGMSPQAGRMCCPDVLQFRRTVERALLADPERLTEFVAGMRELFADREQFKAHLLPSLSRGQAGAQDSPVRLLLGVRAVQPGLVELLVESMLEFLDDEAEGTGNLTWLLLSQLRWLDFPVADQPIMERLQELLTILTGGLQHEVIALLPEILPAAAHDTISAALLELIESDSSCIRPALDAFASFELSEDVLAQVISAATRALDSACLNEVPCIVRFLVNNAPDDSIKAVLASMRSKLNIGQMEQQQPEMYQQSQLPSAATQSAGKRDLIALVLEALRHGLLFRPRSAVALLKAIETADRSMPVDVWVLLVASTISTANKLAVKLFKTKISSGQFHINLLTEAIQAAKPALVEYFGALLALAEQLARSAMQPSHRRAAVDLYTLAFVEFDGGFHSQQVLALLMGHAGSGAASEVQVGLDALLALLGKCRGRLQQHRAHISGVLDFVDQFQREQVHQVFWFFCRLPDGEDQELHIMVRKLLASSQAGVKQLGLVAGLALVSGWCLHEQEVTGSELSQGIEMLGMAVGCCREDSNTAQLSFLYDRLATLLQKAARPHPAVLEWLNDQLCGDIFMKWLEELTPGGNVSAEHQILGCVDEVRFSIDGKDAAMAVSLAANATPSNLLLPLCSHFRLYCAVSLARTESPLLPELDALLGCPVHAFEKLDTDDYLTMPPRSQVALCDTVFATVCWFRQLLESFGPTALMSPEIRGKSIQRLGHILELEQELEHYTAILPGWTPVSQHSEMQPQRDPPRGGKGSKEPKEPAEKPKIEKVAIGSGFKRHYRRLAPQAICTMLRCIDKALVLEQQDTEGVAESELTLTVPVAEALLQELSLQLKTTLRKASRALTPWPPSKSTAIEQAGSPEPEPAELCREVCPVLPGLLQWAASAAAECCIGPLCDCFSEVCRYAALLSGDEQRKLVDALMAGWTEFESLDRVFEFVHSELVEPNALGTGQMLRVLGLLSSLVQLAKSLEPEETVKRLSNCASDAACKLLGAPSCAEASPAQLAELLGYFVQLAPEKVPAIQSVVDEIKIRVSGETPQDEMPDRLAAAQATGLLPVFLKVATEALTSEFSAATAALEALRKDKHAQDDDDVSLAVERLLDESLRDSIKLLKELSPCCQQAVQACGIKQKEVLAVMLRQIKPCLDALVKLMPELGPLTQDFPNKVILVLKAMQKATRPFHAFCNSAKETKDAVLLKLVPGIKRQLETMMAKVQAMVKKMGYSNHCQQLKSKNMEGHELASQARIFEPALPESDPDEGEYAGEGEDDQEGEDESGDDDYQQDDDTIELEPVDGQDELN